VVNTVLKMWITVQLIKLFDRNFMYLLLIKFLNGVYALMGFMFGHTI